MAIVQGENSGLLGVAKLVNLNDDASDTQVPISVARYIVRRVVVTDASVDLTGSAATLGVYTAAAAGGTAVVTIGTTVAAGLAAATDFKDLTVAVTAARLTASPLYIRVGVAHGSAATCSVYIFGDPLP